MLPLPLSLSLFRGRRGRGFFLARSPAPFLSLSAAAALRQEKRKEEKALSLSLSPFVKGSRGEREEEEGEEPPVALSSLKRVVRRKGEGRKKMRKENRESRLLPKKFRGLSFRFLASTCRDRLARSRSLFSGKRESREGQPVSLFCSLPRARLSLFSFFLPASQRWMNPSMRSRAFSWVRCARKEREGRGGDEREPIGRLQNKKRRGKNGTERGHLTRAGALVFAFFAPGWSKLDLLCDLWGETNAVEGERRRHLREKRATLRRDRRRRGAALLHAARSRCSSLLFSSSFFSPLLASGEEDRGLASLSAARNRSSLSLSCRVCIVLR